MTGTSILPPLPPTKLKDHHRRGGKKTERAKDQGDERKTVLSSNNRNTVLICGCLHKIKLVNVLREEVA